MRVTKLAVAVVAAPVLLPTALARAAPGPLDGVYRISWTESELVAAGTTRVSAHKNHGVLTWTLRGGTFTIRWPTPPLCHGTYRVSGHTIAIKEGPGCQGAVTARWSLGGGRLRLQVTKATDPGDEILFGGKSWKKIG